MLINYIKIAFRNIVRHKVYSFINILGLAIGMACAILLLLFVRDEISYDRHNSKYKRIYMLQASATQMGREKYYFTSPSLTIGQVFKDEFPAVEEIVRTYKSDNIIYFKDQKKEVIGEKNIWYADPEIFDVFDHEFIYGSPEGALAAPNTIVLSESLSKKYFGEKNPVGKTLTRINGIDYVVRGVFKDLPQNSFQRYDALMPMNEILELAGIKEQKIDSDGSFMFGMMIDAYSYILLSKNANIVNITNGYKKFRKEILAKSDIPSDIAFEPVFQPLFNIYLHSKPWPKSPISVLQRIYIITAIVILILAIACMNYMNLATARSTGRSMEIGVRKLLGADRVSLMRQFLCESIIITTAAMLIALVLIELFLPSFNNFVGKQLSLGGMGQIDLFSGLAILTILTGLVAGSYPAFVLSSFLPVKVLRGSDQSGATKGIYRKILVVIQYSISILMIICTMLLIRQMNYIHDKDLGFNKKGVFFIAPSYPEVNLSIPVFKEKLQKNKYVLSVAESSSLIGQIGTHIGLDGVQIEGHDGKMISKNVNLLSVDSNFIDLMEMKIIEGRSFNREMKSDQTGVLVNEAFVKDMGWADSPVGKRILFGMDCRVIGVLKDFYFKPLYSAVKPQIIMLKDDAVMNIPTIVCIKINPGNPTKTLEHIKKQWLELNPIEPAEITSLEDNIDNQYRTDEVASRIFLYSAFVGILISCLGLFGLSSFIAENKTKEIGVRKVLGASVGGIVSKLSLSFLTLVIIASIIACPIAYYVMGKWLENFAYKTEMSWWLFAGAICIALVIALATVSYHAIKAALTDPVKALRYE